MAQRKRRKLIGIGAVCVGVAVIVFGAMALSQKSVALKDLAINTVDTGMIESTVSATGRVAPAFEEIINSPISTRIMEVYCKAGDSVAEGTALLRLDLQSAETELNKLEDEIAMKRHLLEQQRLTSRTELSDLAMQIKVKAMAVDRMAVERRNEQYLDSLGSGTGDKVKQVELAYRTGVLELEQMRERMENERAMAEANMQVKMLELNITDKNLGEMRRTLEDARIRAPRAAILTYVNDQVGQKVAEGERIAIVSDLSHFKIQAEAADAYADRIRVGGRATLRVGKTKLDGTIINVAPTSKNGVIEFAVRPDDDSSSLLRSGLKTDVYVQYDVLDDVVRVANGTYYTGPGVYEMFVVDGDDMLVRRKVELGASNYEYVEVVGGLKPGDRVVTKDMKDYEKSNKLKIKK